MNGAAAAARNPFPLRIPIRDAKTSLVTHDGFCDYSSERREFHSQSSSVLLSSRRRSSLEITFLNWITRYDIGGCGRSSANNVFAASRPSLSLSLLAALT